MPTIKARFFGNWIEITGTKELKIDIDAGSTVLDLIRILSVRYGDVFQKDLLDNEHNFRQVFSVCLNGKLLEAPGNVLNDGDEIMFLFPVLGG